MILSGSKARLALPLLRWCDDPLVLVEPSEEASYREAHPDVRIETLDRDDGGFAFLLNSMARQTLDAGERYFVFTDDDVTDLRRRSSLADPFLTCRGEHATAAIAALVTTAVSEDCAQLALSFAGQSWGATRAWQEPVGAWGVHVTDAEAIRDVGWYDEDLAIFNDWEMSARLIGYGYRCARTNLVSFVHRMRSMEGGAASIYDNPERVRAAAETIVARYPHAARLVEAHDQTEVRFNWRKLRA